MSDNELQIDVTGTGHHLVDSFTRHPDGSESWKEYDTRESGVKKMRTIYASEWVVIERYDCYCCTCRNSNPDPHCRNHGFAGRRPCEEHLMPGKHYEQEHIDRKTGAILRAEVMPQSVQAYRREQGH